MYSFNTDYTSLSVIDIRYDIYNTNFEKIISDTTPVSANSIFTNNLGGIYVVPNFSNAEASISDTDFFVDFGDGTVVENNLSAFHRYKTPGNYPLTLVVTNSAGFFFKAIKNYVLNVNDPVPDKIFINQEGTLQYASEGTIPFYITRFNSLETSKVLSANDYKIKLSVDGNTSPLQLESEYLDNKNFQYQNKSYFFTSPDENFEVIESIKTSSTFIYGKLSNGELILSTLSAADNQLVGTSGFGSFRFFEPTAKKKIEQIETKYVAPAPPLPSPVYLTEATNQDLIYSSEGIPLIDVNGNLLALNNINISQLNTKLT